MRAIDYDCILPVIRVQIILGPFYQLPIAKMISPVFNSGRDCLRVGQCNSHGIGFPSASAGYYYPSYRHHDYN
jgi:hypothetical protein